MAVQEGSKAPDFSLKDQSGNTVRLSNFQGKHVVLYFYPKDNTPGCTREACDFRDESTSLQKAGAVVLGVSPDSEQSHQKFAGKFGLKFPLLVDEGHKLADIYGAWGEKSLYGRVFMGIRRMTFLVDPQGRIQRVWPKVKVDGHVQDVLAAIRGEEAPKAKARPVEKLARKMISKVGAAAKKVKAKAQKKTPATRRR
jgi:thioredoxin-dependent peroxiredoxin